MNDEIPEAETCIHGVNDEIPEAETCIHGVNDEIPEAEWGIHGMNGGIQEVGQRAYGMRGATESWKSSPWLGRQNPQGSSRHGKSGDLRQDNKRANELDRSWTN